MDVILILDLNEKLNPISPGGGGYFVPGAWFFLHNF